MRTVLANLPHAIGGFVMEDAEGCHTIVLNARHSRERNRETFEHEMAHIKNGDLLDGVAVDEVERERHRRG